MPIGNSNGDNMHTGDPKDFKVALVGSGMGALALAVGLTRGGVKVDIFEQAPQFHEIGAGVGIGPNGLRALRGLGILDNLIAKLDASPHHRGCVFSSGLPGRELIYDYPSLDTDVAIGVHRAQFLDILADLIPPGITHFNKKCTSVVQSESTGLTTITFADGTTHTADVVVGCDGIRSAVRCSVAGEDTYPKFTRTVAFRALVPEEDGLAAFGDIIFSRLHIVAFHLKEKCVINVVMFSTDRSRPVEEQTLPPGQPWVVPATSAEILENFVGWGPGITNMMANIESPKKWFLHALNPPLTTYVRGNVVLLGDAAHSMLPHLGAGAGQAMEDAYLLTRLLTHPSTSLSNVKLVLQAYDAIRRPRANRVLEAAYVSGEIYEHAGPSGPSLEGIRKDLLNNWTYVWHHDLDADFRSAVKILEDKQVF